MCVEASKIIDQVYLIWSCLYKDCLITCKHSINNRNHVKQNVDDIEPTRYVEIDCIAK